MTNPITRLKHNGPGSLCNRRWIAILVALACMTATSIEAQTQILLNPGLEAPYKNGVATNWTPNPYDGASMSYSSQTTNVHGGADCQKIVVSGLNSTNGALFLQPFQLLVGHVYNASVWLRAATSNSLVDFELRNLDDNYRLGASRILTLGTNWQQVVINGGWSTGTNAQFLVSFLTNGTFWMDDASLTDVTSNYLHAPLVNTTGAVPAILFGMHVNKLTTANNWPPLQQGLIRLWDAGVRWNEVETNTNSYTWSKFDKAINVIYTNNPNCKVIYTLGQTPTWAALNTNTPNAAYGPGASSEPRDMNDWSNYVLNVATRYKGFIQYYEIWNETDYYGFYSGAISNMVTMAQIAQSVLTNVDPTIKVIGPNITPNGLMWLGQYIQAGGPAPDIVSFHDYPASRPENSLAGLTGLQDMLSHYPQFNSLPLWDTEGAAGYGASVQENMGIVSRAYLFWCSQNVLNFNWYTWDITNDGVALSINAPSVTPAPGGIAYSNTVNWLVGAQMTGKTIDTNGTWLIELQRLGFVSAHVLWNPDVTTNYTIPANWNVYQERDLSNNITPFMGVTNVGVGVAPVILDSVPSLAVGPATTNSTLTITWPGPATGFNLYTTTNLGLAAWVRVTNDLTELNGILQVSLPFGNQSAFFRLSSP
jgi:hypothetical protein